MDPHDEALHQLRKLLEKLGPPGGEPFGPVRNPVDRLAHLPEPTRLWLEELRPDDLDDIRKILEGYRRTGTILWALKWAVITLGSGFVAAVAFGEKLLK